MKRGDLVRVKAVSNWGTHLNVFPSNYGSFSGWPTVVAGETVMLLDDIKPSDVEGYIDVMHPQIGACSILRRALEAI